MQSNPKSKIASPLETTLALIGGKWKLIILSHLCHEPLRFNQLRRLMPEITQAMLAKQLKDMESDNLVHRQVFAEVPPRVEYSMTESGKTLQPIIEALIIWGEQQQ